jgi:hypothetical protein
MRSRFYGLMDVQEEGVFDVGNNDADAAALPARQTAACKLGLYFSSSMAFTTRARAVFFTSAALLSTRETVAVETLARRATCSKFMANPCHGTEGDESGQAA